LKDNIVFKTYTKLDSNSSKEKIQKERSFQKQSTLQISLA